MDRTVKNFGQTCLLSTLFICLLGLSSSNLFANPGATTLVDPIIPIADMQLKSIHVTAPYNKQKKTWQMKAHMVFENSGKSSYQLQMRHLNWFPFFENPQTDKLEWDNFALKNLGMKINNRPIQLNVPTPQTEEETLRKVSAHDAMTRFRISVKKGINTLEMNVEIPGANSQDGLESCFQIPVEAAKPIVVERYWAKNKPAGRYWNLADGGCQSIGLLLRPLVNWQKTGSKPDLLLKVEIPPAVDPHQLFVSPKSTTIENSWITWDKKKVDFSQDFRLVINQPRFMKKPNLSKSTLRAPFFEKKIHLKNWIRIMQENGAKEAVFQQMRALILGRFGHKPFDNHLLVFLKKRPWYQIKKKFKKSSLPSLDASLAATLHEVAHPAH